jgi:hypothetical protein
VGIGLSCLSYVDYFKIGCLVDDSIMKDPQVLVSMIEANLRKLIEEGKNMPPIEKYK